MLNNYFILKSETGFLNRELKGSKVTESFLFDKNTAGIVFGEENPRIIKFQFERNLETLYLDGNFSIPKKNFLNIFPSLNDAVFVRAYIADKNRVIYFEFDNSLTLVFYAVPNRANLFVVKDRIIEDCRTKKSEFTGKDINTIIPKPASVQASEDTFKSRYNYFGKHYRGELERRTSGKQDIDAEAKKLESEISGAEKFFIYSHEGILIPSQIELGEFSECEKNVYDDINSLISAYYRKYKYLSDKSDTKSALLNKLDAEIKRTGTKISNLKNAVEEAGGSQIFKMHADALLANIYEIRAGAKSFEYKDGGGEVHTVKLNPGLSVQANASRYYAKYKGLKNSVESLNAKLNILSKEYESLLLRRQKLESEDNLKTLRKMDNNEAKKEETSKLPFRIFKLSDKFEAWVGKDSASNDLLTMKYTNQYDYWFHVRGFSGSHTTLKLLDKNLKPEKDIILKTAAIAAYYSKARNGKHVPVAYTEKKYVKKRKGFKQGSVVMEKEKIVFVNPEIPEM